MKQMVNILGLFISLALTLSGGAILFQVPGVAVLVIGTLMAMAGLMLVGLFMARIFTHTDSPKDPDLKYPVH